MKVFLASVAFLGALVPLAFSKNESENNSGTEQFAFVFNCTKNETPRMKQDGVDPCEHMLTAPGKVNAPAETDKKL